MNSNILILWFPTSFDETLDYNISKWRLSEIVI